MRALKWWVFWYFAIVGLSLHMAVGAIWALKPELVWRAERWVGARLAQTMPILATAEASRERVSGPAVVAALPAWRPLPPGPDAPAAGTTRIAGRPYPSVQAALAAARRGDTLDVGAGVYTVPLVIRVPGIAVVGHGHVVFEKGEAQGKANMVVAADDVRIRNIECRFIAVRDANGACIRLEGRDLTLEHVYFHDSEQGVLTGSAPGRVVVRDSRFERLGKAGQAHGIYVGGGSLTVSDSLFLASQDQGHEIKSRAAETTIVRTVVASLNGVDSRLVDVPDGGDLSITGSLLQQGPNTANGDLVGYGLEGGLGKHPVNRVLIHGNLILIDRDRPSRLLHLREGVPSVSVSGNVIVTGQRIDHQDGNTIIASRRKAGLPEYPALPLERLFSDQGAAGTR